MCGRYTQMMSWSELVELYRIFDKSTPLNIPANDDVRPTNRVPIVRQPDGNRALELATWGFVMPWNPQGKPLINAKAEGIDSKRTWKKAFQERRCLIPANGFFEWQKVEGQKQKLKHRIQRRDGQPIAFAGLWEVSTGGRDGIEAMRCTIITTQPNEVCRPIHSRMPVILDPEEYDLWLDLASARP